MSKKKVGTIEKHEPDYKPEAWQVRALNEEKPDGVTV